MLQLSGRPRLVKILDFLNSPLSRLRFFKPAFDQQESLRFTLAALENAKQEGLVLAVRARWIALLIIAIMLPVLNPNWEVVYYIILLGLFALIGWAQLKVGKAGVSLLELSLMFCDLTLLTIVAVVPNPMSEVHWPPAMQYRTDTFIYFFVILAGATLSYSSWRTILSMGTWTVVLWFLSFLWIYFQANAFPGLSESIRHAVGTDDRLFALLDPASPIWTLRLQEAVVFAIVAFTLAIASRRSNELLMRHVAVERERTNLARYFSPNVVQELSKNDEPLKQVRTQHVAVLFADIIGFTAYADGQSPEDVIQTLRVFHGRMEQEVFRYSGTLDKYLGDGLMATFGTPFSGERDAMNAVRCAQAMIDTVAKLNEERGLAGDTKLNVGFGLHYGPVVLGDIGINRLEFAVIGSTVNAASRLESLTRSLNCSLVASEDVVRRAKIEEPGSIELFEKFVERSPQSIRGIEQPIPIWTYH